jgi:hypothetical protein
MHKRKPNQRKHTHTHTHTHVRDKQKMVVLFWDIGLKNLSVCAYRENREIVMWDVCDTGVRGKAGLSAIVQYLSDFLERFSKTESFLEIQGQVRRNVIENQPKMNPTMRIVSSIVGTFFYMKFGWKPMYYNPAYKLMHVNMGTTTTTTTTTGTNKNGRKRTRKGSPEFASAYRMRKRASIDETRRVLENEYAATKWLPFFELHSKKDDLADTFLMARAYFRGNNTDDDADDDTDGDDDDVGDDVESVTCPIAMLYHTGPPVKKTRTPCTEFPASLGHYKFLLEERLHKDYGADKNLWSVLENIKRTSRCKGIVLVRDEVSCRCTCDNADECRMRLWKWLFQEAHWSRMFNLS